MIKKIIDCLYKYIDILRKENKLTAFLGILDRFIYAMGIVLKQYTFIGVWLGIKIISRLTIHSDIKENNQIKEIGEKKNIFLIGNIVSLIIGIIGGLIVNFYYGDYIRGIFEKII